MEPVEPQTMPQDGENVIGLQPGQADREGAMAKADLYKIANYSHKLFKQINDEDQMEAWVQAKITKAADYIASVYHYLEYEMKFSQYGQALEDSEVYSESQKRAIKNRLMEAKEKVKELKKVQADKVKADADDKVSEGILSGGHRECTECGGSGMVYEEPKPIPAHVKGKVDAYKRLTKATHAAHKRMDANGDGVVSKEEEEASKGVDEEFTDKSKTGDTFKTRTGVATKTDTGMTHSNTSYHDDGDEIAANAKSGKGKASHAKAQSAAEKKDRAPAQKQSPKSAKTWGMKDSEKFDNRDGAPAKPKKEKEAELDESLKGGQKKLDVNKNGKLEKDDFAKLRAGKVKESATDKKCNHTDKGEKCPVHGLKECGMYEAAKPSAGLSKAKKSAVVKDAKAGKDIGKPGKSFDKTAKAAGGGEKGEKIAAAAMWKNIKETQAYIAEKAKSVKPDYADLDNDGDEKESMKDAAKQAKKEVVKESADLSRMKQFLTRLNG